MVYGLRKNDVRFIFLAPGAAIDDLEGSFNTIFSLLNMYNPIRLSIAYILVMPKAIQNN